MSYSECGCGVRPPAGCGLPVPEMGALRTASNVTFSATDLYDEVYMGPSYSQSSGGCASSSSGSAWTTPAQEEVLHESYYQGCVPPPPSCVPTPANRHLMRSHTEGSGSWHDIPEGRVVGRVFKWCGPYGFLVYHMRDNIKRRVYCAAEATGGRSLEHGDVVEFTLHETPKGPTAQAVLVIVKVAPPAPVVLETSHYSADRLEPSMEDACEGDVEMCMRCLADYTRTAEAPERLRLAASEYVVTAESVKGQQETLLETDMANGAQLDGEYAAACIACFKEAWAFMKTWQMTPSIPDLCGAHAILGRYGCRGPGAGHFRTRALRVGQCRFISHNEVPTCMARYVQALEHIIARADLSPHAKAAWAAYHFLAIHPFLDGNGRFARLLINWVLLQAGVPFVVVLCGSEDHRAIWQEAILTGHRQQGCSRPMAGLIATTLARVWGGLELATERAIRVKDEAAEDRALRAARDRAKKGTCGVCLETGPNITLVCCGAAYHMSCMSQWLSTAPRGACPACRAPLPPLPQLHHPPSTSTASLPSASHHLERIAAALGGSLAQHPTMEPIPFSGDMPQFLVMASMQGLCAFCPNQRATDCALRACGRCCAANQRLHGVYCSRHALEHRDVDDWSDSTMSSNFHIHGSMW